ncbi:Haloacid dehalogenase [Oceanicaulis sp. 350]|nr:Haloacid dehalogenase [Oceanicaulis sp. 350]
MRIIQALWRRSKRVQKSAIILDLDNTIWDWVEIWFRGFKPIYDGIKSLVPEDESEICRQISAVHQKYHTSEYSLMTAELPCLLKRFGTVEGISKALEPYLKEARIARKKATELYIGVGDTLLKIKPKGAFIIGYTESQEFYTLRRIKQIGMDGVFDSIYLSQDRLSDNFSPESRLYKKSEYELSQTKLRKLPLGELKPNPQVLRDIMDDFNLDAADCVYVGDSLMKDIPMAQALGVEDVFAKYGTAQHREEYDLLRAVTHWTPEDVQREKEISANKTVKPTYTLKNSLYEIFDYFDFYRSQSQDRIAR